jgi:anaphase-promoting complex subunit 6
MEVDDSCAALERLRSLVADLLDKHLLGSAVFFADKLVSLSDGAAEDVFLLAQAHVCSGAHTRALALLRAECLTSASPRFLHLTAACLVATAQFDEALALLGEEGTEMHVSSCVCALSSSPPHSRLSTQLGRGRR